MKNLPQINQEEYEVLKKLLSDGYEWVARDSHNSLCAHRHKPVKQDHWTQQYRGIGGNGYKGIDNRLFHFIQWEDEEPYNIQELIIEEYVRTYGVENVKIIEIDTDNITAIDSNLSKESEETEVKKDKQWALKEVKETINGFFDRSTEGVAKQYEDELIASIADIIDQLDEPEILSGEWIADHYWISEGLESPSGRLGTTGTTPVIRVEDLQSLHLQKNVEELNEPDKKSETVASVMADFFGAAARLKEVLAMEVKELEE